MKIDYYENTGVSKYLENLAVSKYFVKSDSELVGNDIIDYCRQSRLRISRYERMKSALKAIERTEGSYDYYIQDFNSFREMVNFYMDQPEKSGLNLNYLCLKAEDSSFIEDQMKLIMTCDKNDSNYKVLDYMLSVTTKGAYFKYVYNYVYYDLRRKELVSSDRVQLHLVKGFKVKGMTEGLYSITKKGSCMSLSKIESDMSFPRYDHLITEWKNNSSYVKTTLRHPLKDVLFCKIIRLLRDDLIIRYEYFLNIIKYLSPSADFDVHINNEDISPVIICAKISGYDIISLIMPEAVM